jgi:ribosome-associated translation inhibitor RaiA
MPNMKLILSHARLPQALKLEGWIKNSIHSLLPLLRIDEAQVSIEHQADKSPAYRATAHLKVPGPDLRAEGVDHTVRTALDRVLAQLRQRAAERAGRRSKKHRQARVVSPFKSAHFSHA